MVSAPRPGVARREEEANAAQTIATLTVRGESHKLALNNIPLKERTALRRETGLPLEAFVGGIEGDAQKVGLDTFQILWWLARRADGEPGLALDDLDWPEDLEPSEIEMTIDEPDAEADDPEV